MRASSLLFLCCAPLLASCIFLLDYDALEGTAPVGGAAGDSSSGAQGGESAGGAGPTCGDCNDGDPCTIDTCSAPVGEEPSCQHVLTQGLKLDGFRTSLPADQHLRVAMVGSGKLFYLSALELDGDETRVSLYRLADDGAELEPLQTNMRLEGSPISNVGLAVEELAAGEVALHGFVATKAKLSDSATRVLHIESRNDKMTSNLVGASYRADNLTVFPQALALGNQIVGAWIQADGTIAVHRVGEARTEDFGDATLPATTLSLLSTNDDEPAVMYTSQADEEPLGTWVEGPNHVPARVEECEKGAGSYLSSSVISTQVPGVWLANITRAGEDYLTTGGGTLGCNGKACLAVAEDCKKHPSPNALRNTAGASIHFDTDEAGIVYLMLALPHVIPKTDGSDGLEGKLSLLLARADFNEGDMEPTPVGGDPMTGILEIAKNDAVLETGFAGPDWPAIAILPGARAAVAWIAPSPSGQGTELHVERYKMCLAQP